jgi:hypothetical protein
MIYLYRFVADVCIDTLEGMQRLVNFFKRKKDKPSLIVCNVLWFTESNWVERLVAYKQLELWTADKQC